MKRNTIEFSQQVFDHAATSSGYSRSSLPTSINRSRAFLYRSNPVYSSYLSDHQQFRNSHALPSRSWFPSTRHHNTLSSQYMVNSLGSQLGTQQIGLTTNSYSMNMSAQLSSYQSFNTGSSWLNSQPENPQDPWMSNGYAKPNSVSQLESIVDQQVSGTISHNNFNHDNNDSSEFATLFSCKYLIVDFFNLYICKYYSFNLFIILYIFMHAVGEEQQQINSSSVVDAEMERQVNICSTDVQSYNFEDNRGSNHSDLTVFSEEHLSTETIEKALDLDDFDFTDDLHIALLGQVNNFFLLIQFIIMIFFKIISL